MKHSKGSATDSINQQAGSSQWITCWWEQKCQESAPSHLFRGQMPVPLSQMHLPWAAGGNAELPIKTQPHLGFWNMFFVFKGHHVIRHSKKLNNNRIFNKYSSTGVFSHGLCLWNSISDIFTCRVSVSTQRRKLKVQNPKRAALFLETGPHRHEWNCNLKGTASDKPQTMRPSHWS